jgi:type VI secretion system protein ImpE
MDARELIRSGDLAGALAAVQRRVKAHPEDARERVFLFQVLCLMGAWERAMTQLEVIDKLDAAALSLVRSYAAVIQCERFRAEVFLGQRAPVVFGEPQSWLASQLESVRLLAHGRASDAAALRDLVGETASAISGSIDGQAFAWLMDADPRLGPVCEAFLDGKYYWIPFNRIARLVIEAPTDLRDLVWAPAQFTWTNGGEAIGFIPARYPGSESSTDAAVKMSRKTDWQELAPGYQIGMGQRLLATDNTDYALLDVREICFDNEDAAAES